MSMGQEDTRVGRLIRIDWVWAALRIGLGWIFLWAFLDKVFGLGYATPNGQGWIDGFSPTKGYLNFGTSGLFSSFWQEIAGNNTIDILFMTGLLLIGGALILGVGIKIACIAGSLFMLLLFSTNVPPVNNPIIDEHIIFIIALIGIAKVGAGKWVGIGKWWSQTGLVKRFPILE
jgi:thiosulfate dehydrogenase [quinone] large subunit